MLQNNVIASPIQPHVLLAERSLQDILAILHHIVTVPLALPCWRSAGRGETQRARMQTLRKELEPGGSLMLNFMWAGKKRVNFYSLSLTQREGNLQKAEGKVGEMQVLFILQLSIASSII